MVSRLWLVILDQSDNDDHDNHHDDHDLYARRFGVVDAHRTSRTEPDAAIITNADGTTQDVTKTSIWQASDPSVAAVTADGVLTTIAPGSVHLSAAYQTTNQGFDINVVPVTTTFTGALQSSNGQTARSRLSSTARRMSRPTAVSSQVTGTLRFREIRLL